LIGMIAGGLGCKSQTKKLGKEVLHLLELWPPGAQLHVNDIYARAGP
jgi:hypothetical protein